jgi:hypothetical protein
VAIFGTSGEGPLRDNSCNWSLESRLRCWCAADLGGLAFALQERLLVELDNVRVLVTDQKIETIKDIIPILEVVSKVGAPAAWSATAPPRPGALFATAALVNRRRVGIVRC